MFLFVEFVIKFEVGHVYVFADIDLSVYGEEWVEFNFSQVRSKKVEIFFDGYVCVKLLRCPYQINQRKLLYTRKIRLTRRFSLFCYWIYKINKQMKYLASWQGVVYSVTNNCFDLVRQCCRVTLMGRMAIKLASDLCLADLCVPDFKHQLQKILLFFL